MNELHLFSGAGGGILGGLLLGHTPVCAVEIKPYCRKVLLHRQRDGILPWFPIWDDVRTFDGKPWRGLVDVICGGFPCQDISVAGKGAGLDGARSGLWAEFARIIREIQPSFAFVENSPMLTLRGLDRVIGDLAEMGFNAEWGVVGARHAGAPHHRERIWIFSYNLQLRQVCNKKFEEGFQFSDGREALSVPRSLSWWNAEPDVGRMAYGLADDVDRIKAIGNGQVPAVVRKAWHVLCQRAAAGTLRKRPAQHTTAAAQNTA